MKPILEASGLSVVIVTTGLMLADLALSHPGALIGTLTASVVVWRIWEWRRS